MDNIFINALVKACTCQQHAPIIASHSSFPGTFSTYHRPRRRTGSGFGQYSHGFHDSSSSVGRPFIVRHISREDYIRILDYYREPYTTQAASERVNLSTIALPLPVVERDEIAPEKPVNEEAQVREDVSNSTHSGDGSGLDDPIEDLVRVLGKEDAPQESVFDAYSALPYPGVVHLPAEIRRLLLHRLSVVEVKNQETSMRFLSVVDDMKAADLGIAQSVWNSAISFTGRCFVRVSAVEVENAIRMWKDMEQEAGVRSGSVTFNILFDIATKAGKFVLAEMILQEMSNRKLPLNRYARTGLIYYYGLKGDGQGVRKAYRELVDSGHIVDTVVMDCVIVSLLKAGEQPAAEQVYERMKQMFARKTGATVPTMGWRHNREIGHVLDRAERALKSDPDKRQRLQDEQFLAPDLRTYSILIEHHVSHTGELRRVTRLLDEMQSLGISIHGKIFLKIFKGFAYHGGIRYTSWTRLRLESVWAAFVSTLDSEAEDVHLQKWMVVWIIRAFSKCFGRARALEVWAELKTRWKPDAETLDVVHHLLRESLMPLNAPESDYSIS